MNFKPFDIVSLKSHPNRQMFLISIDQEKSECTVMYIDEDYDNVIEEKQPIPTQCLRLTDKYQRPDKFVNAKINILPGTVLRLRKSQLLFTVESIENFEECPYNKHWIKHKAHCFIFNKENKIKKIEIDLDALAPC